MGICTLEGQVIDYTHHIDEIIHDLNTPIQSLKTLLLTSKEFSREKRELAREAFERIDHLMQAFTQNEFSKRSFLLLSFLKRIVQIKQYDFQTRSINFSLKWEKNVEDLVVSIDQGEFSRVILNILNNAQDALEEKKEKDKRMELAVSIKTDYLIIKIWDNGYGLTPFPAITGNRQSSKRKGQGLGLFHAKKAMTFLKGRLEIQSILNEYTNVFLVLPVEELK